MLNHLLDSWTSLYANHAALRTAIEFTHIGGLVAGGGCAITADLATITAARGSSATPPTLLQLLKRTHRLVVLGLVALAISGLLLFAADVETFLYSRIFWLKMGLMGMLLRFCQNQAALSQLPKIFTGIGGSRRSLTLKSRCATPN